MTDHHNPAEAASQHEVLERIGRNLLLFQQAERWLKYLAARKRISGMSDEFRSNAEKLKRQVAGETLGTAVRRTITSADPGEQARIEAAVLATGRSHLEVGFSFTGPEGEPDVEWQQQLEAMVEDRNELVHHLLDRFDLGTVDGCHKAGAHLDRQHARHAPVVEELRRRCADVLESAKMLVELLKREDFQAEFLHGHLRHRLEEVLRTVAAGRARDDGWTHLSLAGNMLAEEEPGLLKRLEQAFGNRGLKQAVAAMDGWELSEEPTKSGFRVLYRCCS